MKFYQKAVLLSLGLHLLLAAFLFISPSHQAKHYVLKKTPKVSPKQIIKTETIDSRAIESEIARIQNEKRLKQLAESKRQESILKQTKALQALQSKAKKELKRLKNRQANMLRKQKALEKQQAKEKAQLLKGQQKLKKLRKRLVDEKKAAVLERAKAAKAEKLAREKKLKAERALKAAEARKKQQQEATKLAEEKRQKQQLVNAEVDRYKALIISAISQNWILPPAVNKKLSCQFEIHLVQSGEVTSVKLLKSSGDPVLDRSARTAIYQASPLPVPTTPAAFAEFKIVSLMVKPEIVQE